MRKIFIFLLALGLAPALGACSGGADSMDLALEKRTALLSATGCAVTADIVADYGERLYEYTISCDYSRGSQTRLEVVRPEELAGISATLAPEGDSLEFEELVLDTGPLTSDGMTPIGFLPALVGAWENGYISTSCVENSASGETLLYVSYLTGYGDGETEYRTWYSLTDGRPVRAEAAKDGETVVSCTTFDFAYK